MEKVSAAVKRQYAIVVHVEEDGDFIDVKFIRKNGEKVIGMYQRWGWVIPPRDEAENFKKIMNSPPRSISGKRSRS